MARCNCCGKRGLFLRLQNGMCSECHEASLNKPPVVVLREQPQIVVPDEPIKRDTIHVPAEFVVTNNGQRMEKQLLPNVFRWDGIKRIDNNFYGITSQENIQTTKDEIMKLNAFLDEAANICKSIPDFRFRKSSLRFEYNPNANIRNYCMLSFNPMTASGKLPKAMVNLHFMQGEKLHGEIKFDGNGAVYRAEIITLVTERIEYPEQYRIEQNATAHCIVLAIQGGELKIRFIYRNANGVKTKVYDSKTD